MKTIWLFLCRLVAYPYIVWGGYGLWSKIFRAIWQQKYLKVKIKAFETVKDLVAVLNNGYDWRPDSWKSFGDAIGAPGRVQMVLLGELPKPTEDFDCDEYAAFGSAAVEQSRTTFPQGWPGVRRAYILTVTWLEGWKPTGHNVTLLELEGESGTQFKYLDYGFPSEIKNSIDEVAALVRTKYGEGEVLPIVWCASTTDLKPYVGQWGAQ